MEQQTNKHTSFTVISGTAESITAVETQEYGTMIRKDTWSKYTTNFLFDSATTLISHGLGMSEEVSFLVALGFRHVACFIEGSTNIAVRKDSAGGFMFSVSYSQVSMSKRTCSMYLYVKDGKWYLGFNGELPHDHGWSDIVWYRDVTNPNDAWLNWRDDKYSVETSRIWDEYRAKAEADRKKWEAEHPEEVRKQAEEERRQNIWWRRALRWIRDTAKAVFLYEL